MCKFWITRFEYFIEMITYFSGYIKKICFSRCAIMNRGGSHQMSHIVKFMIVQILVWLCFSAEIPLTCSPCHNACSNHYRSTYIPIFPLCSADHINYFIQKHGETFIFCYSIYIRSCFHPLIKIPIKPPCTLKFSLFQTSGYSEISIGMADLRVI